MSTEKEKQHYVPKFYLRRFSFQKNEKQIGVYNTKSKFIMPAAPLKSQAYKPFFYGRSGEMEDYLSEIEGDAAMLLRRISENNHLPKPMTSEHWFLLFFTLLSELRNPMVSKTMNGTFNALMQQTYGKYGEMKERISQMRFGFTNAIFKSLEQLDNGMKYCQDLSFKLIKNTTNIPFIISDNPVIKYNQFLESRKFPGGHTGFTTMGLQILYPIDAETLIIFYDATIYKVGDRKEHLIETSEPNDINQINILQFLNCEELIFFNDKILPNQIKHYHIQSEKYEKANQIRHNTAKVLDEFGRVKSNREIVMLTSTDCKTNMSLSFIKQTKLAKTKVLDDRAVQLRDIYFKITGKQR